VHVINIHISSINYTLSIINVVTIPPPIHKVDNPLLASLFFIACNKVTTILAPDAPIGCPSAIAPPF